VPSIGEEERVRFVGQVGAAALMISFVQSAVPPPRKGGNPDAAKVRNPVASTAESTAAGRRI
jgi:hypothetical protein